MKDYQFEDISVGNTVLKKCLRLNLIECDRSTKPEKATVWLSRDYGIVKWIRLTGCEEVLDLKRRLNGYSLFLRLSLAGEYPAYLLYSNISLILSFT